MLTMQLIAQSNGLNLYYYGDMIMAGTSDNTPMTDAQEKQVDEMFELFMMEFEGRA